MVSELPQRQGKYYRDAAADRRVDESGRQDRVTKEVQGLDLPTWSTTKTFVATSSLRCPDIDFRSHGEDVE